jgi:hypothetical protein
LILKITIVKHKVKSEEVRSISMSSGDKKIEYFPNEEILIKGSGSLSDPL